MKLLAIDTATERCSVALWNNGEILQQDRMLDRAHAEVILPMVDSVLAEAGCVLTQLDGIAFGRGPGGFTGVRVAVSVAQGLAFGAQLPVLPVSDLAAIAAGAYRNHGEARVIVCMDARMAEVYWGQYHVSADSVSLQGVEAVLRPEDVPVPEAGRWFGAGAGFAAYRDILTKRLAATLAGVAPDMLPEARDIVSLAAQAHIRGKYLSPEHALPVYLRDQVAWPKRAG